MDPKTSHSRTRGAISKNPSRAITCSKLRKKIECTDAKLSSPNKEHDSLEQKQTNLKNLHIKSKLLLKNNLDRKKALNCKVNQNEQNQEKATKKESLKRLHNENTGIQGEANISPRRSLVKKPNLSKTQNENEKEKNNSSNLIKSDSKILGERNAIQLHQNAVFDYPYNFISAVKNKLSMAVNSPRRSIGKLTRLQKSSGDGDGDGISNVISDLKSSLSEIQNLTLSISFHDVRPCQCPNDKNNSENKPENQEPKTSANLPALVSPDCVLTPQKVTSPKNSINENKNHFSREINLLHSFNESLNHIQKVDEVLSSIRTASQKHQIDSITKDTLVPQKTQDTSQSKLTPEKRDPPKYKSVKLEKLDGCNLIFPTAADISTCSKPIESLMDVISDSSDNSIVNKKQFERGIESFLDGDQFKKHNFWKTGNRSFVGHLCRFCICLISQNIEDEKSRLGYLTTFLKFRERSLVDAARTELLCLEVQKKQYHDQIPLLKKKQRGLLLKLQQERYEIKHIKKFHLAKSQERKEALKRQLKHLKILLLVDAYNSNRKNNQLKKSTLSITRSCSPIKGIDLSNDSLLKEQIGERRHILAEQKKQMSNILLNYYDLQIDKMELDALEKRIDIEKKSLQNKLLNDELLQKNLPQTTNLSSDSAKTKHDVGEITTLPDIKSVPPQNVEIPQNRVEAPPRDVAEKEYVLLGSKLNELWHRITGNDEIKYDASTIYNMLESELEIFFNSAKEIAYKNLLESPRGLPNIQETETKPEASIPAKAFSNKKVENTPETDSSDSTARSLIEELENFPNDISHSTISTSEVSQLELSPVIKTNILSQVTDHNVPRTQKLTGNRNLPPKLEEDVKTLKLKPSEKSKLFSNSNFEKFDNFLQAREEMFQESKPEARSPSPESSLLEPVVGEYSPAFAAMSLTMSGNDEAEELRKQQLAIEREIKALERQQSQMSYCIVREIPDKPPPPYIPPTEESKVLAIASQTTRESIALKPTNQVINTVSTMCEWIWSQLNDPSKSDARDYNLYLKHISKKSKQMPAVNSMFLFDLCNETFESEHKKWYSKVAPWEYREKLPLATYYRKDLFKIVEDRIKKILNIDMPKENVPMKTDEHVEKLLIKELYEEEAEWGNVEKYEVDVKNEITNSILHSLILEAVKEYKSILTKKSIGEETA